MQRNKKITSVEKLSRSYREVQLSPAEMPPKARLRVPLICRASENTGVRVNFTIRRPRSVDLTTLVPLSIKNKNTRTLKFSSDII